SDRAKSIDLARSGAARPGGAATIVAPLTKTGCAGLVCGAHAAPRRPPSARRKCDTSLHLRADRGSRMRAVAHELPLGSVRRGDVAAERTRHRRTTHRSCE